MVRNLIIYKVGLASQEVEPLGDLGVVTDALNGAFIDLEWQSPVTAALPVDLNGGFRVKLTIKDRKVQDIYTDAGFSHIRQFAGLCERQGWRMVDAQGGNEADLKHPQEWYELERGRGIPFGTPEGTAHALPGQRSTARKIGRVSKWVILVVLAIGLVALGFYLWQRFGG